VVNAVAHIHIETPWLTKQGFVAGGAAAIAVAGRVLLRIRLRFHNHAPQKAAIGLAFHQQATDEVGGDQLGGAGEEGLGEGWEGFYGYGSGLGEVGWRLLREAALMQDWHTQLAPAIA
jgi:hypothetical protein